MTSKDNRPGDDELRGQIEQAARRDASSSPAEREVLSPERARQALHELRVHQIELETQNEELRRAQLELDAVRARYFDLYDLAPVGYLTLSEQGLILEANLTAACLLGVERRGLVKETITRFVFPGDQDLYYKHRQELFRTGEPQTCELRMVKSDGAHFWARLEAAVAQAADGTQGCRAVLSDITARRQDEDVSREREARHRTIIETAMDGFWLVDAQGRLLEVNAAYSRMSGYSVQQLLTMRIPDLEAVETDSGTAARIQKILAQGEDRFESRHRRQDGSIFDVEVSVKHRPAEEGRLVAFLRDITGRKRAEEAQRDAEARYRMLFEQSPDGIVIIEPSTAQLLVFNEAAHRQLGYSREEFSRLSVFDLEAVETAQDTRVHIGRVIREGRDEFETRHRTRQGEIRDVYVVSQASDMLGNPIVHCVWRDITARKQAEKELRESESQIRSLLDDSRRAQLALLSILEDQKGAEEALTKSDDQLRRLNEDLERHVGDRTRELEDARRVALSMLQDADIQRRNTEEVLKKLAESTSRQVMLWQAVENSPAIVVITDPEANIQYVNTKFVDVTGYSSDEAVGKNARLLKSGEHTPEFYQHLWATIKAGKTWFGEFCNRKKSGELYWEAASISPVRASDGEIHQFLAIKEDVTEFKRTAEVLMRAKEEADAANQAKSAFLASMSHEIRTPLNAILGYSQLVLRDDALGEGTRESLHIINRSGEHLLALINDVLEVAKIEAGRLGLEPVEFDLHAMLDDLAAMFRLPAMEKGIGLQFTKAKDLPRYVFADEGKTRQVLINILGNAVKFTKQGHVKLGAAVSRAEAGQLWLAVEVEDTGSGIAPEEMGKLFQYFEQTRSGRETLSGTGLGLVISRDYARKMGGDISVASEQGKGSVFRFEIPIAPIAAKPSGELPDGRRVAGLAPGQAALRVLVVDDQDTNRGWLSALLDSVGFDVREAGNGREALEIWQAWRPELILMDMRMPLMDGYEATRRIRLAPGGDSTVIIALTASALDEPLPAMMDAGVDDLVCKPFKEGHLFDRIKTHLDVRFRYDESEEFTKAHSGELAPPAAVSLSGLSAELLTGMRQAILGCDMDGFLQLLPQVAEQDPSVVVRLRTLAEKYDYDALAQIVSEAE